MGSPTTSADVGILLLVALLAWIVLSIVATVAARFDDDELER